MLSFKIIPALLGQSEKTNSHINYVVTDRKPGEAMGAIVNFEQN